MRLGIDFGTTRIAVAFVDRGNYPVVSFDAPDGVARDWFPPLVAVKGDERVYGWEAWEAQEKPGWTIVRSLKRALESAGPKTCVQVAHHAVPMLQLLSELASSLRRSLIEHSTLPAAQTESLEVMLGVPANANSNQRYLTAEAFRRAGFEVLGLLNEPSAASIEFGHRNRPEPARKGVAGGERGKPDQPDRSERGDALARPKTRILVYDLGGGTFDASLVEMDDQEHVVIASEGIPTLGGDDFDGILADLALEAASISPHDRGRLTAAEHFRLHEECRERKEALHPNTRRIAVDLSRVRSGWQEVAVPASDYYEHCRPLVDETIHAVEDLLAAQGYGSHEGAAFEPRLEALYVTGGGSELPLVGRALREVFGRRVRRSAYTRSATAIGLAIQADAQAGYRLRDHFTRYFGVWREAQGGRDIIFDPLFPRGVPLPGPGDPPLVIARRYLPAHNIGHFRYLECSRLNGGGRPAGDITIWDEIRFPFDPAVQNHDDLREVPVELLDPGIRYEAEERYACDAGGTLTVTISNLSAAYSRRYRLGRWAAEGAVVPGRKKRVSPNRS